MGSVISWIGLALLVVLTCISLVIDRRQSKRIAQQFRQSLDRKGAILAGLGFVSSADKLLEKISIFLQRSFRPYIMGVFTRASDRVELVEASLKSVKENGEDPIVFWFIQKTSGKYPKVLLLHNTTPYPWFPGQVRNLVSLKLESNKFEWDYEVYVPKNGEIDGLQLLQPDVVAGIDRLGLGCHIEFGPSGCTLIIPVAAVDDSENESDIQRVLSLQEKTTKLVSRIPDINTEVDLTTIKPYGSIKMPMWIVGVLLLIMIVVIPYIAEYTPYLMSYLIPLIWVCFISFIALLIRLSWRGDSYLESRRR